MDKIIEKMKKEGSDYVVWLIEHETLPIVRGGRILFLYHEPSQPITSVRLVHHVSALDCLPVFERIGTQNTFALQLILPGRARMEYTFGVTYETGEEQIRPDPHNPNLAWCPFGPKSVVTTSLYQNPDWGAHKDSILHGSIEVHTMRSKKLRDERTFIVYTPALPPQDQVYPLLFVHDGTDYIYYSNIIDVFDNLIAEQSIPPIVVVLTKPLNRNDEYTCTPQHPAYLAEELLPWITSRYPVTTDRNRTAVMGASFGAIASLYAAYKYPDLFGQLLIQSGSFRFGDLVRAATLFEAVDEFDRITNFLEEQLFVHGFKKPVGIFLSCGTFESIITYNREFVAEMRRMQYAIEYHESHDGHNWICWRDHLADGLSYTFPLATNTYLCQEAREFESSRFYPYVPNLVGATGERLTAGI